MGLLDGIIGNVVGSMLGGNQTPNSLGEMLGKLGGGSSLGGNPDLAGPASASVRCAGNQRYYVQAGNITGPSGRGHVTAFAGTD
jgi:hypothetical protein